MKSIFTTFTILIIVSFYSIYGQIITTPDTAVCTGSDSLIINVSTAGGTWFGNGVIDGIFYLNSPDIIIGEPGNIVTYEITSPQTETDSIIIVVNESPMIENIFDFINCDDLSTHFLSFSIIGGTSPYLIFDVNEGDTSYLDSTIIFIDTVSNFGGVEYIIESSNQCRVHFVGGAHLDPIDYPGTMNLTPIEICEGDTAIAIHNGDSTMQCNEIFEFSIHDGSGDWPYSPLAINSVPVFTDNFYSGFVYGQTYYISAITGNDNGLGHADSLSNLYNQSMGTPVIWHEVFNADAGINDAICGDEYTLNAIIDSGVTGTWTTNWEYASFIDSNSQVTSVIVDSLLNYGSDAQVLIPFTWTTDNEGCVDSDTVQITFYKQPEPYAGPDDTITGLVYNFNAVQSGDYFITSWNHCLCLSPPQATYAWSPSQADQPDNTVTVSEYGTYLFIWNEVNPYDNYCRDNDSVIVVFNDIAGVKEYSNPLFEYSIYPNPTHGITTFYISKDNHALSAYDYTIYNTLGLQVLSGSINSKISNQLDMTDFSTGIYYLSIEVDGKIVYRTKVVKK